MPKDKDEVRRSAGPENASRQDRLKLALRENLKRRKAQARGRHDAPATPSAGRQASLDDGGNEASD